MEQINFENVNYNRKEELEVFINSLNDLVDKYISSFNNKSDALNIVLSEIQDKNIKIDALNASRIELSKREEELAALRDNTNKDIENLEFKKGKIEYTDSEVQKMEAEDIETLIVTKKDKISKIEGKLETTRNDISSNDNQREVEESRLKTLEEKRKVEEDSLLKTEAILNLTETTQRTFTSELMNILQESTLSIKEKFERNENETLQESIENDFEIKTEENPLLSEDVLNETAELEEPVIELNPDDDDESDDIEPNTIEELNSLLDTQELSVLDFGVTDDLEKEQNEQKEELLDNKFKDEGLNFNLIDNSVREKMLNDTDRVLNNMNVLKKHSIPLNLTIKQSKIYTDINPNDLDDLLAIITTDEDGNGMGFSINYTYHILNELASVDVDKLIDVYNDE